MEKGFVYMWVGAIALVWFLIKPALLLMNNSPLVFLQRKSEGSPIYIKGSPQRPVFYKRQYLSVLGIFA
jgi:hypothetical protein